MRESLISSVNCLFSLNFTEFIIININQFIHKMFKYLNHSTIFIVSNKYLFYFYEETAYSNNYLELSFTNTIISKKCQQFIGTLISQTLFNYHYLHFISFSLGII